MLSFFFSKRDNELLLRLIANLNMLLRDESVNVVKKAILTLTQLYKVSLQVMCALYLCISYRPLHLHFFHIPFTCMHLLLYLIYVFV